GKPRSTLVETAVGDEEAGVHLAREVERLAISGGAIVHEAVGEPHVRELAEALERELLLRNAMPAEDRDPLRGWTLLIRREIARREHGGSKEKDEEEHESFEHDELSQSSKLDARGTSTDRKRRRRRSSVPHDHAKLERSCRQPPSIANAT